MPSASAAPDDLRWRFDQLARVDALRPEAVGFGLHHLVDDRRSRFRQCSSNQGERIMWVTRKTALLVCAGLFSAWFASSAVAQERGNAADFVGVWDTVIPEVNAKYQITLRITATNPDGSLVISGEFVNIQDRKYNGTINGVADPNLDGTPSGGEFSYYYYQPKVKAAGTGSFIVDVTGRMAGFVKSDGDSKRYVWEGRRISGGSTKPTPPAAKLTAVKQDVDMYETEDDQNRLRSLTRGTMVELIRCNANDRCNVVDKGQAGWIYDGASYDTLDR